MIVASRVRREGGAVTAEAAVVLPVIVLFTVTMAWLVCVGLTQLRALDAAREVARAAARSDGAGAAVGLGQASGAGRVPRLGASGPGRRGGDRGQSRPGPGPPARPPRRGPRQRHGGLRARARAVNRSDRGLATVLAIAMSGLLLALTVGVLCGVAVVGAHRAAQSAADLAALAGAGGVQQGSDGCARAAAIAARNHARLQQCEVTGWNVSVVVVATARLPIGRVELPARARAGPVQASVRSFSSSSRSSRL